jgi:hypothetical protein
MAEALAQDQGGDAGGGERHAEVATYPAQQFQRRGDAGGPMLVGSDQVDVERFHRGQVLPAPKAAVGEEQRARLSGGEAAQ